MISKLGNLGFLNKVINEEDLKTDNWAFSFSYLLNDEVGAATFMKYLKEIKNSHNLTFWFKCRNFKMLYEQNLSDKTIKSAIKDIYKNHIRETAKEKVNLTPEFISNIEDRMDTEISELQNLFDPAQKKIYLLMFKNFYSPFLSSKPFLDAVESERMNKKYKHTKLKDCRVFLPKQKTEGCFRK